MSMQSMQLSLRSAEELADIESEIRSHQKEMDFSIREYPIEVLVSKYINGLNEDENEIFIPEFQRDLVWQDDRKSRFIESVFINIPIGYLYGADSTEEDREGCIEIIDGSQRLRSLVEFVRDEFPLCKGLKYMTKSEGMYFSEFEKKRQRRFLKTTIRIIELTELADDEAKRELFDRLNTGGVKLLPMETRRGSQSGKFIDFLEMLKNKHLHLLQQVMPITDIAFKRREYEERLLRFFAFSESYSSFGKRVDEFLDKFVEIKNISFDHEVMESELVNVLEFARDNLSFGYKKNANAKTTPRIRFEAIAIGTNLALRKAESSDELRVSEIHSWLSSEEFQYHTRSDGSNSLPKVVNRIHFVRDSLLGAEIEYYNGNRPVIDFKKR